MVNRLPLLVFAGTNVDYLLTVHDSQFDEVRPCVGMTWVFIQNQDEPKETWAEIDANQD